MKSPARCASVWLSLIKRGGLGGGGKRNFWGVFFLGGGVGEFPIKEDRKGKFLFNQLILFCHYKFVKKCRPVSVLDGLFRLYSFKQVLLKVLKKRCLSPAVG